MSSRSAGEQVLIASNRGPVSFAVGDDGQLSAQRGGGGMVSGLASVASHANVLWGCAAPRQADPAAPPRGGGGRVPGLAWGASHANVLWVCAALSEADRMAARRAEGGRFGLDGSSEGVGGQMLDICARTQPEY